MRAEPAPTMALSRAICLDRSRPRTQAKVLAMNDVRPVFWQSDMLETLLIDLWQAIYLTGNIQSEAKDVDGSEFLRSVARAELNLVEAISELMRARVSTVH